MKQNLEIPQPFIPKIIVLLEKQLFSEPDATRPYSQPPNVNISVTPQNIQTPTYLLLVVKRLILNWSPKQKLSALKALHSTDFLAKNSPIFSYAGAKGPRLPTHCHLRIYLRLPLTKSHGTLAPTSGRAYLATASPHCYSRLL